MKMLSWNLLHRPGYPETERFTCVQLWDEKCEPPLPVVTFEVWHFYWSTKCLSHECILAGFELWTQEPQESEASENCSVLCDISHLLAREALTVCCQRDERNLYSGSGRCCWWIFLGISNGADRQRKKTNCKVTGCF